MQTHNDPLSKLLRIIVIAAAFTVAALYFLGCSHTDSKKDEWKEWYPVDTTTPKELITKEDNDNDKWSGNITIILSCKLREKPSMSSKQIGYLPRNSKVWVESVNESWYEYYDTSLGLFSYIGQQCVRRDK